MSKYNCTTSSPTFCSYTFCLSVYASQKQVKYRAYFKNHLTLFVTPRVQNAIAQEASEMSAVSGSGQPDPRNINKVKKQARKILQEMVANVSPALIR